MSSLVFPVLSGLTYDVARTPMWHTEIQSALSGKRSTLAYMQYPLIHFEVEFSILRDDLASSDVKAIVGLFNALQGGYDTFLFSDPDFNTATLQSFGTGDGSTTSFQLTAFYQNTGGPGYGEIVQNLNGTPAIYKSGALQGSGYTVGTSGIVTFTTAPASGVALTWSGGFYYRCAFDEDKLQLTKFMNKWWNIKKLPFTSVKL